MMNKYTTNGYTYTVDELLGANPMYNENGTIKENCVTKFTALNRARFEYELDQVLPTERAKRIEKTNILSEK